MKGVIEEISVAATTDLSMKIDVNDSRRRSGRKAAIKLRLKNQLVDSE